MSPKIGFEIEPSYDPAVLNRLFDTLVARGKQASVELAKSLGIKSTITAEIQVVDGKLVRTLKESVDIVDKLNKELQRSEKIQKGSITNLQQSLNTYKQQRNAITKLVESVDPYGKKIITVNKEWEVMNRKVQEVNRALQLASANSFWDRVKVGLNLQGLQSFSRGVSDIVNGFQSLSIITQQVTAVVNTLVNSLKGVEQIGLTFQAIGQGAAGGAKALQEASRIALNLGVDINTVREGFLKLSPVILQSGGSLEDVSKITQALSSRFAAFGKSADEAKRVTNAVIQAFGKGALRSEELNQQIAEADQAFRVDFANALGVTTQKFGEMVEAGEITNAVLLKTLPLLDKSALVYGKLGTSALDAGNAFGTLGVTTQQIQSKIATINQLSLEAFANSWKPAIKVILQLQGVIADLFAVLARSEAVKALGAAVASLGTGLLELIKVLTLLITLLLKVVDPFAKILNALLSIEPVAKAIGVILAVILVAAFVKATVAAIAFSAALGRSALGLLGFGGAAGKAAVELSKFGSGAGAGIGAKAIQGISTAAGAAGGKILQFGKALALNKVGFSSFGTGAASAANGVVNVTKSVRGGIAGLGIYKDAINNTAKAKKAMDTARFAKLLADGAGTTYKAASASAQYSTRLAQAGVRLAQTGRLLALLNPATIGFTAATTLAGLAVEDWAKATAGANAVNERTKTAVADAKASYEELKNIVGLTGEETSKTADRQSDWLVVLQKTINVFGDLVPGWKNLNSEATSYEVETAAVIKGQAALNGALAGSIEILLQLSKTSADYPERNKKIAASLAVNVQALDRNREALEAQLKAVQNERVEREGSEASRQTLIGVLNAEIQANKARKLALLAVAAASGVDVSDYSKKVQASAKYVEQLKKELEALKEKNKPVIEKATETKDEEIAQIDKIVNATTKKNEREIGAYERAIAAAQKRYAAEDQAIERTRQLRDRAYNEEISKLDKLAAAVAKVYDARVRDLQGPTAAESQLAAMDKAELQKQAANAETQRERLQAKAQLERLEREKQIAAIQAQKEKELEALAEEKARKEAARAAELIAREEADYERKISRQQEIGASQDEIDKRREENRKAEEKAEDDRDAAIKRYEAIVLPLQDEIKNKTKELESAERNLQKERDYYNEKLKASVGWAQQELEIQQKISAELRNRGGGSPSPSPSPSPTYRNSTGTGGTRSTYRQGAGTVPSQPRFAGGAVAGGATYTVNELGREAFLSRSGRLSYLNTPAWGQWTAPGAGTVIPAHITAGLNIPSGGTRVNSGAVAAARSSSARSDNSLAKALGMALGGAQGRVTNNVTIQSENPTRSASDILVQLTKIKRNRYR